MITTSKLNSSIYLVLQYFGAEGQQNGGPQSRAEDKGRGSKNTNTRLPSYAEFKKVFLKN